LKGDYLTFGYVLYPKQSVFLLLFILISFFLFSWCGQCQTYFDWSLSQYSSSFHSWNCFFL